MTQPLSEKLARVLDSCREELPGDWAEIRRDEAMSLHTAFRLGGKADLWVRPRDLLASAGVLLRAARREGVGVFVLGAGANIVVADRGIRGIVLDTSAWTGIADDTSAYECSRLGASVNFLSGTGASEAAALAMNAGLSGLEFLAGMPGSLGGALWMNARAYGREIADALLGAEIIHWNEGSGVAERSFVPAKSSDFGYKRSPFQERDALILSVRFALEPGDKRAIQKEMEDHRRDREAKGHYLFPCAGSVFKNNRSFGKPTGKIIDELGLKGLAFGGAEVAPFHGNIIINRGGATAADIRALTEDVAARVKAATGCVLEPEILFVGDWENETV